MKNLIFLITFLYCNTIFAQISIDTTVKYQLPESKYGGFFVGPADDDKFYYIMEKSKTTAANMEGNSFVCYADMEGKILAEAPVIPNQEKLVRYKQSFFYKNKMLLFTTRRDLKAKQLYIRYTIFDKGIPLGTATELLSTELNTPKDRSETTAYSNEFYHPKFGDDQSFDRDEFYMQASENGSKIVVFKKNIKDNFGGKGNFENYNINMLDITDDKVSVLWNKSINMEYKPADFEILDGIVDDFGNLYLLGMLLSTETKGDYKYKILKINAEGKVFDSDLKPAQYMVKPKLGITKSNGNIFISGYYLSMESRKEYKGFSLVFVDAKNGSILLDKVYPFDPSFGKIGTSHYITNAISHEDGNISIIGEEHEVIYKSSGNTTSVFYRYNNILLSRFNSKGELIMMKCIEKKQSLRYRGYGSFVVLENNNNLFFCFNDKKDNIGGKEDDKLDNSDIKEKADFKIIKIDNQNQITQAFSSLGGLLISSYKVKDGNLFIKRGDNISGYALQGSRLVKDNVVFRISLE